MSFLLVIALVLLLVILWILFLRIRLIIDTEEALYELRLRPLAKANLMVDEESIAYEWSVLFWHKRGEIFPAFDKDDTKESGSLESQPKKEVKSTKTQRSLKRRMTLEQGLNLSRSLLSSFKVNRFRLFLNTDDAIYNAWLYPVFTYWRSKGHDVELRFFGTSELILDIENALHRVLGVLFYNYLFKPLKS